MRIYRGVVVGVVALTAAYVLSSAQASAAGPTAPYNAFTINAGGGSFLLDSGGFTFDDSNATITSQPFGIGGVDMVVSTTGGTWQAFMLPPTGQTLGVGTYQTAHLPDDTHAQMQILAPGRSCDPETGTLTIHELTRDQDTGAITAFAATYSDTCNGALIPATGEMRFHSNMGYKAATPSPFHLDFGLVDIGQTSPTQTVTMTSNGSLSTAFTAASLTGTSPDAFQIVSDTCAGATLAYGETCTVGVAASPFTTGGQTATLVIPDDTAGAQHLLTLTVNGQVGAVGTYYPVEPARLLDTRTGLGAPKLPLGQGQSIHLQVSGRGGVPAVGVGTVVLNMTVTNTTTTSFLTVFPTGTTRPTASNLNWVKGFTGANSVTVPLGAGGRVDIFNAAGSTAVIADVVGFYAGTDDVLNTHGVGGNYHITDAERILDTRTWGFGPLGPGEGARIVFTNPDLNPHLKALVVNVTAVSPTQPGYLLAWGGNDPVPNTSTLNFAARAVVPNLAIVPLGTCTDPGCAGLPQIVVANGSAGNTHVLIDIFGFMGDSTLPFGMRFKPLTPTRIVDTRSGLGLPGALGSASTMDISAPPTVAGDDTFALVTNTTAVNPTQTTFLTLWEFGQPRPNVSNLNPPPGRATPNGVVPSLSIGNKFSVYNNAGTTHLLVDVAGSFEFFPFPPPVAAARGEQPVTEPRVYSVHADGYLLRSVL